MRLDIPESKKEMELNIVFAFFTREGVYTIRVKAVKK